MTLENFEEACRNCQKSNSGNQAGIQQYFQMTSAETKYI